MTQCLIINRSGGEGNAGRLYRVFKKYRSVANMDRYTRVLRVTARQSRRELIDRKRPLNLFSRWPWKRKMRRPSLLRILLTNKFMPYFSSLLSRMYLKIYRPNLSLFTFNAENVSMPLSSRLFRQFFSLRLHRFVRNRKFHFYYVLDVFFKIWRTLLNQVRSRSLFTRNIDIKK